MGIKERKGHSSGERTGKRGRGASWEASMDTGSIHYFPYGYTIMDTGSPVLLKLCIYIDRPWYLPAGSKWRNVPLSKCFLHAEKMRNFAKKHLQNQKLLTLPLFLFSGIPLEQELAAYCVLYLSSSTNLSFPGYLHTCPSCWQSWGNNKSNASKHLALFEVFFWRQWLLWIIGTKHLVCFIFGHGSVKQNKLLQ